MVSNQDNASAAQCDDDSSFSANADVERVGITLDGHSALASRVGALVQYEPAGGGGFVFVDPAEQVGAIGWVP